MTLYFKCLYHDEREALYRRHCGIIQTGTNREVPELSKILADRIEGTPSKKVATTAAHVSNFILTTRDGQQYRGVHARDPARGGAGRDQADPGGGRCDSGLLGHGQAGEGVN